VSKSDFKASGSKTLYLTGYKPALRIKQVHCRHIKSYTAKVIHDSLEEKNKRNIWAVAQTNLVSAKVVTSLPSKALKI
jgi:hypothetical protein